MTTGIAPDRHGARPGNQDGREIPHLLFAIFESRILAVQYDDGRSEFLTAIPPEQTEFTCKPISSLGWRMAVKSAFERAEQS